MRRWAVPLLLLVLGIPGGPVRAAPDPPHRTVALAAEEMVGVRPVDGPVVRGFSAPPSPYGAGHRGVDLRARPGERVRAVRAGRVAFVGVVAGTGWVTIDHGGGLSTTYGDVLGSVEVGARLRAGEVLGTVADGAVHLDWGARIFRPRGPHRYLDPLLLLVRLRPVLVAPQAHAD